MASEELAALPGVGPRRLELLERLGVRTVRDLLLLVPRRFDGTGKACTVAEARESAGEVVRLEGRVRSRSFRRFGRRSTLRVVLEDESGAIDLLYYNQPWQRDRLASVEQLQCCGRVTEGKRGPALIAPRTGTEEAPLPEPGRFLPVYPTTEGLGSGLVARLIREARERHGELIVERLDEELRARHELADLRDVSRQFEEGGDAETIRRARRRALLEELLHFEARVLARKAAGPEGEARAVPISEEENEELLASFPFDLTAGQREIAWRLRDDLAQSVPMRRLLQGDVGSGKTILGLYACLIALKSGAQCAFMAPTELLAEQHFAALAPLLELEGIRGVLLTAGLAAAERKRILARIESGNADVVFGTHALFSSDVRYHDLALAVIDEQQRFGVSQRTRLVEKGRDVHLLLMTATPIPRTLALTIYGDLEVSCLREKPPGRATVSTRWLRGRDEERLPHFLRERLEAGERVYWVVPRIGPEGEEGGAEKAYAHWSKSELAGFGVELVHGRQSTDERSSRLERFRAGESGMLVGTTIVEVGVDVPEATVIVIEEADRLGLAQLHQLRGRVGRSERPSWCLLRARPEAEERMRLLESCDDGFRIAEEDLAQRGMGELDGLRQSGESGGLSFEGDAELLLLAREILNAEPRLLGDYLDTESRPVLRHAP